MARLTFGPLTSNTHTEWQQLTDDEGLVAIEGNFAGGTAKIEFASSPDGTPLGQNTELVATATTPLQRLRGSDHLWARLALTGAGAGASVTAFIDF